MNLHQKTILFAVILSLVIQLLYIYQIATLNLPLPDDAYYYLSLARNVAEGNGPKIDSFNNTTGFQPLWGAICIFAFSLIRYEAIAISSLLFIGLLAQFVTGWLLYKWMLDLALPKIAIVLTICWWLLSPLTMLNMLNGMETGLGVLGIVAVFYSLKFKNAWITGVLCGLAVLARTDALILGISMTLVWFYKRRFKQIIILWLCVFLAALPWMIFTLSIGKMILPESGQAVRLITLFTDGLPYYSMSESLWNSPAFHWGQLVSFLNFIGWNAFALYPFSLFPNLSIIFVCVSMILITIYFRKLPGVVIFLLYTLGLIAAYSLFVGGNWYHFRYTISVSTLLSTLIIGLFYQQFNKNQVRIVYAVFVSSGLIVLHILFNPLLVNFQNKGVTLYAQKSLYDSTVWMNTNILTTSTVGAFQSGAISYYAEFPVLNLDGKVNHYAYIALKNKNVWEYICQENIDYVMDWPSVVDKLLIKRSSQWKNDNLTVIKQVSGVNIYAVNRSNCLSTNKGSN